MGQHLFVAELRVSQQVIFLALGFCEERVFLREFVFAFVADTGVEEAEKLEIKFDAAAFEAFRILRHV
jgi:hypothetical protein